MCKKILGSEIVNVHCCPILLDLSLPMELLYDGNEIRHPHSMQSTEGVMLAVTGAIKYTPQVSIEVVLLRCIPKTWTRTILTAMGSSTLFQCKTFRTS